MERDLLEKLSTIYTEDLLQEDDFGRRDAFPSEIKAQLDQDFEFLETRFPPDDLDIKDKE